MINFEKKINKKRRIFSLLFTINMIFISIAFICIIYLFWNLFSNPELIGEFFGKIMKGFNSIN